MSGAAPRDWTEGAYDGFSSLLAQEIWRIKHIQIQYWIIQVKLFNLQ